MSLVAITWALNIKTGSPSAKLVLIKLADQANDSGKCWPSVKHMVEHTELSERAIREHIKTLEYLGLISIEKRYADGVRLPNCYILNLRQTVGVVQVVQGGGARGAPPVVHHVQGNSKPSKINPHLTEDSSEPLPRSEPAILLPTNRFETAREEKPIFEDEVSDYETTYPGVDVRQELRGMRRWLIDNPKKRKTVDDMKRFVNNWLAREQDKGHASGSSYNSGRRQPSNIDNQLAGIADALGISGGTGDGSTLPDAFNEGENFRGPDRDGGARRSGIVEG